MTDAKRDELASATFAEAWAEKEREGYLYGEDALEQVRFGWDIAQAKLGHESATLRARVAEAVAFAGRLFELVETSSRWLHDSTEWEQDDYLGPQWQEAEKKYADLIEDDADMRLRDCWPRLVDVVKGVLAERDQLRAELAAARAALLQLLDYDPSSGETLAELIEHAGRDLKYVAGERDAARAEKAQAALERARAVIEAARRTQACPERLTYCEWAEWPSKAGFALREALAAYDALQPRPEDSEK